MLNKCSSMVADGNYDFHGSCYAILQSDVSGWKITLN